MALMLVDHTREFFYIHQQVADPMLIGSTAASLFFTRFTSHFCAPLFVLLTGISAWLHGNKARLHPQDLSAYLAKRGVFLIMLELTLVNFAWSFQFHPDILYLQVIWAIGLSMLALSALLWLPHRIQLVVAISIIAGHNLLDGIHFANTEGGFIPWAILHDRQIIELGAGLRVRTSYPLLPWIGIILLGFAIGPLYQGNVAARRRQSLFALLGLSSLGGFAVLRLLNGYGDHPWQSGLTPAETVMSFLNITKYPPSLHFTLLTLGTGFIALSTFERRYQSRFLADIGRVPMFFYLLHLYALHLVYLLLSTVSGTPHEQRYSFSAPWQLWCLSAVMLGLLYWPCRQFAHFKRTSTAGWPRYF